MSHGHQYIRIEEYFVENVSDIFRDTRMGVTDQPDDLKVSIILQQFPEPWCLLINPEHPQKRYETSI